MPINLQRFDLVTLRLFVLAVGEGSLTAGAARLGLSLAAASKRIGDLEAHVGTSLLERSRRGVVTTDAGRALLPHAVDVVARIEQLALAMDDVRAGVLGCLRLRANMSAMCSFLPGLLAAFARAHPRVVVDLEDAFSEDAVRAVARGAAELAVIGENTPAEMLQTRVCHVDELVLVAPIGHSILPKERGAPVAFGELLEHDLIAFARSTSLTRQLATAAETLHRPLRIRIQVRSFDAMAGMVAAGLGLAVLPRTSAIPCARALGLVIAPLEGGAIVRRLLWAMRDADAMSPAASALLALQASARSTGQPA